MIARKRIFTYTNVFDKHKTILKKWTLLFRIVISRYYFVNVYEKDKERGE